MQEYQLIAKTFQGLEEVLAQELTELGANDIQMGRRMVSFTGNKEMMYRANFCLRTAVRILKPIHSFEARTPDEVYSAIRAMHWEDHMDADWSFAIDTVAFSQEFRNSRFVTYRVKDAIVDRFREDLHAERRPNISVSNPDLRINVHIAEKQVTVSLDSSGDSLHLRGYRVASVEAPINEVMAAAMIKMSGWQCDTDFIDPFCGSGTLLIEAALIARNIYPGIFRQKFGFENWKDFDRDLLDRIYEDDSQEREFNHHIKGYDLNVRAVEAALANVKSAGVSDIVTVEQQDFENFQQPAEKAIIVTNPPYGERLRMGDTSELYAMIGTTLKHQFVEGEAWIISSREELFESIGMRPSFRVPLLNGELPCEFRKYQVFAGRMKDFKSAGRLIKSDDERRRMTQQSRKFQKASGFRKETRQEGYTPRISDDRWAAMSEEEREQERQYRLLRQKHQDFERQNNPRPAGPRKPFTKRPPRKD